jgi:predicted restriction endonuclease
MKRVNYRKLAFEKYPPVCAHCGFGVADVLEVCHIDCQRSNNDVSNLVILCPTCHKMHDLDLISTETICTMRDRPKVVRWAKRMKDAGAKAALSRRRRELARGRKWHLAAVKAAATRRRNTASKAANPASAVDGGIPSASHAEGSRPAATDSHRSA